MKQSKKKFGIVNVEDLTEGQIVELNQKLYFIFIASTHEDGKKTFEGLPIRPKKRQEDDNRPFYEIDKKHNQKLELVNNVSYIVELDHQSLPQRDMEAGIVLATKPVAETSKQLHQEIMREANKVYLEKKGISLDPECSPAAVGKKHVTKWRRESMRAGEVVEPPCSIETAAKSGFLNKFTSAVLKNGTLPNGEKVETLNEVFRLATSSKAADKKAFRHLYQTGVRTTKTRLSTLFDNGFIDESTSIEQFEEAEIRTLANALKTIDKGTHPVLEDIAPEDIEHLIEKPLERLVVNITTARQKFLQTFIMR